MIVLVSLAIVRGKKKLDFYLEIYMSPYFILNDHDRPRDRVERADYELHKERPSAPESPLRRLR